MIIVGNNFKYKTDEYGRVEKITVENLDINQARERSEYQQQKAKDLKDGKTTDSVDPTDDGGHMVASQFWGPSEQINYFPQNAAQNRAGGQWYEMETELRQLRLDNPTATIKIEIVPIFPAGTSPIHGGPIRRPQRFVVSVKVDGVSVRPPYNISNP
jgi:hypothetical protein